MQNLRILVHHAKHGDTFWLADTPTRAAQAREALFRQIDEMGFYVGEHPGHLKLARDGNIQAIKGILESRRGCEYENWDYEHVEIPHNDGVPGLAELSGFGVYQQVAHSLAIYPDDGSATYAALGLTGEVGETIEKLAGILENNLTALRMAGKAGAVANQIKKIIRDDGGTPTPQRKETILKELGDCLWYVAEIATKMGYSLTDVAYQNMVNLFGRKDRGTLGGDGDNR